MRRLMVGAVVVLVAGLATARAEDKDKDKAKVTGTWKWSVTRNGQTRETTLKLKLDGGKLTGAIVGRDNKETAIEDASYKDGQVSFKVVRERDGQKNDDKVQGEA